MTRSEDIRDQVRAWLRSRPMRLDDIAAQAEVTTRTLHFILSRDGWDPKLSTLARLERVMTESTRDAAA